MMMGTIATDRWLLQFLYKKDRRGNDPKLQIQYDTIIQPLSKQFPHIEPKELHQSLLEQGLFSPDGEIGMQVLSMKRKEVWKQIQKQYMILKNEWNGPNIKIFIFPLEERNRFVMEKLGGKMGVSFTDKILIFLSSIVDLEGINALLTHEYHHACRLSALSLEEEKVSLLDSLIIEGLAELAVEHRCGEKALAKWTSLYSEQQIAELWENTFTNNLMLRGKKNHQPYLYGSSMHRIPLWAGYAMGYEIVKSCGLSTLELLRMPSDEILERSNFSKENTIRGFW